ncbi:hypothetical protein ACFQ07_08620, partial [Actinomadura adrarensis]
RTVVRGAVAVRAALVFFLDLVVALVAVARAAVPRLDVVRAVVLAGTDLPPRDDQQSGSLFHRT